MLPCRASTTVRLVCGVLALGGFSSANPAFAAGGGETSVDRRSLESAAEVRGLVARLDDLDPIRFFKRLVDRYRAIEDYVEETEVEQVTDDPATDDPPIRTRTRVRAEVRDDRLVVERPGLLDDVGRALTSSKPGASEQDLWLLPHLRLRFSDSPLEEFRPGEDGGFRAAEADRVLVDDREMVRVELRAGGDEESGPTEARFSLFVDPERMLVERVEGEEWLPGGLRHQTTLRIKSMMTLDDDPGETVDPGRAASEPVPGPSAPTPSESEPFAEEGADRGLDASPIPAGSGPPGTAFLAPLG